MLTKPWRTSYLSLLFSGTLHSLGYILPFLLCLLLPFFLSYLLRPPQTTTLSSCISFSWGFFLVITSCTMLQTSVHSSSTILPDLVPWIFSSPPLYNHKQFDALMAFPTFFKLSLNFTIRSWWSEPQSAPGLVFADCIGLLHLRIQRI